VAASRLPPLPAGRVSPAGVVTYTVRGTHSGLTGKVEVQLPPGYQDPRRARLRYPVMEAFPGYPGGPGSWIHTMALGSTVSQLVAARRMREVLVVSPQVELPQGVDTECVNGIPGRPQVETWLARDVPDWVARTFRVRTSSSAAFLEATRPPMSVKALVLQHAGHRISLWQSLLPTSLVWLGHNVPGFAPVP
jgi:hypothetical protein